MFDALLYFYGYLVFFYSMALIISYAVLSWLAMVSLKRNQALMSSPYIKTIIKSSPYTPGVSIIAPAYNEEKTIVGNVHSLLGQDYPLFEVIIVNDGSKDRTLELLIEHFDLVEVPYIYRERIHTKPFRRLFRSTNPAYSRLSVADKVNGGTKADPVNVGLNIAAYPFFINTDVDCILAEDAIFKCIRPTLESNHVIAVSGVMNMINGCKVIDGKIIENRPPLSPIPLFQTIEYLRSFLIGKMGWSTINAISNVSGGYGLFNTEVAINAGGYSPDSLAEDMDMIIRMIGYCCDFGKKYRVVQIPDNCCWTEGPSNLRILYRQRVRWGRGLIQTFTAHKSMILSPKYRQLGMITLPYIFVFEFLAPIIEAIGFFLFIYLALTGGVNWSTAGIMFSVIFLFCLMLSIVVVFYDFLLGGSYSKKRYYWRLVFAALLEPFVYHPIIVFCSLKGFLNFLIGKKAIWGEMTRKGYSQSAKEETKASPSPSESAEEQLRP